MLSTVIKMHEHPTNIKHTLPAILYKNFEEFNHLENFKKGNILIRKIGYHQNWENKNQRLDTTENKASYSYNVEGMTINGGLSCVNPVYILSTSGPSSNRLKCRKKFGINEVKIQNPELFRESLEKAWNGNELFYAFYNYQVEYSKGETREAPLCLLEPSGLSLYQKSKDYSDEEEYRFVFMCKLNPDISCPDSLTLKIDSSITNHIFES